MRPKSLSLRKVITRGSQRDPRGVKLESVAAEFALLAQRRARMARQVDLLARQLTAATGSLAGVRSRMAVLAARMALVDPDLGQTIDDVQVARTGHTPAGLSGPASIEARPAITAKEAMAPAQTGFATKHRPMRHLPRRRSFAPE